MLTGGLYFPPKGDKNKLSIKKAETNSGFYTFGRSKF